MKIQRFGWIPDLPDIRDYTFTVAPRTLAELPPNVDLLSGCPGVYDQGLLGSCTANAIAGAMQFDQAKQGRTNCFTPSRLFIYYNERAMEGTIRVDAGAMIRDGIKSVVKQGAPREVLWPYDITQFARRPSSKAYIEAKKYQAIIYERLTPTLDQLRGCLASGYPFVFGFSVYEFFESDDVARTGTVNLPQPGEVLLGGHAVLATGYDDIVQRFNIRNSWGDQWGNGGYFTMPYTYLTDVNLSDDFWVIRLVE